MSQDQGPKNPMERKTRTINHHENSYRTQTFMDVDIEFRA